MWYLHASLGCQFLLAFLWRACLRRGAGVVCRLGFPASRYSLRSARPCLAWGLCLLHCARCFILPWVFVLGPVLLVLGLCDWFASWWRFVSLHVPLHATDGAAWVDGQFRCRVVLLWVWPCLYSLRGCRLVIFFSGPLPDFVVLAWVSAVFLLFGRLDSCRIAVVMLLMVPSRPSCTPWSSSSAHWGVGRRPSVVLFPLVVCRQLFFWSA